MIAFVPYCAGCGNDKAALVMGGSYIPLCLNETSTRFAMGADPKCENCRVPILWKKVEVEMRKVPA